MSGLDTALQEGDLCIRRMNDTLFEVSIWRGSFEQGGWHDLRPQSLTEVNKFIRSQQFLGKVSGWEYYRPIKK